MAPPEGVHTFIGRLATFEAPHHLTKRRASSTKKKTPTTVTWPHERPAPDELAQAGFFYKPTSNNPDNVMCFLCERSLDGWEPADDPISEHLQHSPECGWAINMGIKQRNVKLDRAEEDPMGDAMVEARKATFQASWPHEAKRGWKCKTQKMVEAGWFYDPSPEMDDGVTCSYCSLSLDGWEPKDDPLEEHRRRSPDCYFFSPIEEHMAAKKAARGKKVRGSRVSKASRLSNQSTFSTFSEAPSLMSIGDAATAEEDDSVLTTATAATTTSMAGKGKKKTSKQRVASKGTKRMTKKQSAAPEQEPSGADDTIPHSLRESALIVLSSPSPPKSEGKSRPKRATRRNTNQVDESHLQDTSSIELAPRITRARNARGQPRTSEAASQVQLEEEIVVVAPPPQDEMIVMPKRGTKRTSDGLRKVQDTSTLTAEEAPAPPKARIVSGKSKKGKKTKVEEAAPELEPQLEPELEQDTEPLASEPAQPEITASSAPPPPPKPAFKSRKGKKTSKQAIASPDPIPSELQPPPSPSPARPTSPSPTPAADEFEPSPTPQKPRHIPATTIEPILSPRRAPALEPSHPPTPPPKSTPSRPSRRSNSPQSSDAENMPPSARAAQASASATRVLSLSKLPVASAPVAEQGTRIPLASTPSAQFLPAATSPSGLPTTHPWTAADLESIFLPAPASPSKPPARASLAETLELVQRGLTTAEKEMSLEDWVRWQAARGEERLRAECERLVGVFEREGLRALRAVEGVEVV
ncbi:hypothetical protein B0A49_12600 [Cryomyces minteri]|uniref:BIR-domain-containing protein n=1 Tax=Cryomyces minteri TaxID=331657 RepID=A0A4U0VAQ5_9PEZI|nr:hypothetical protein B0A49_12600 [Cryomyces minteri]